MVECEGKKLFICDAACRGGTQLKPIDSEPGALPRNVVGRDEEHSLVHARLGKCIDEA